MSSESEILKQTAYNELAKLWNECRTANWDGDEPIEYQTVQNAHRFIEALPPDCALPSVSAEADGHLELEWYRATNWLLSVSVSPEGMLYWAALMEDEDPRGRCSFDGEVPQTILSLIRRVCAR